MVKATVQHAISTARKVGRPKRPRADLTPVVGRQHVRAITDYLQTLRTLYPHPNRVLFYDDVVVAYLLAFFNPTLRSLRCVEDMSRLGSIQRFLSVDALCRSTLSEANALFDPNHLLGLIAHVRSQLPRLQQQDPELAQLWQQLVCLDGSFFRMAGDVQWAMWHRNSQADTRRHLRLNCAFCESRGVPLGVSISGDDGVSEGAAAVKLITTPAAQGGIGESDPDIQRIYLFDSGVVSFDLLSTILGRGEHLLCNLRQPVGFRVERELPFSAVDQTAGVVSDRVGRLQGSPGHPAPAGLFREILIPYTDRNGISRQMRLLTDLLALPAHLIAALYRHRWQVELFFRWLKMHAHFRHLMSFSRNGITSSFYIAVLAAMLLCLHTQQPLNKYALNLFGSVASGLATPAEVLPILARRTHEKELERQRLARNRAKKIGK